MAADLLQFVVVVVVVSRKSDLFCQILIFVLSQPQTFVALKVVGSFVAAKFGAANISPVSVTAKVFLIQNTDGDNGFFLACNLGGRLGDSFRACYRVPPPPPHTHTHTTHFCVCL